ncbi:hypothetical protein Hanom_Chr03g00246441 [Helianthus anomalus]
MSARRCGYLYFFDTHCVTLSRNLFLIPICYTLNVKTLNLNLTSLHKCITNCIRVKKKQDLFKVRQRSQLESDYVILLNELNQASFVMCLSGCTSLPLDDLKISSGLVTF